jgi:TrmH family RNA methyltransferase
VTHVPDHVLRAVADTNTPQGLVAVAAIPKARLRDIPTEADLVLVLAEVRDPGNAGTLVRSAAAAGAGAVVFTEASVDPYAPKTARASAGALFALPVIRNVPLADVVQTLADRGLHVYLAEAWEGSAVFDVDLTEPVAFIVGNEARGIPETGPARASALSIPMPGGTESLNVAIAGSILLYETVRQRSRTSG